MNMLTHHHRADRTSDLRPAEPVYIKQEPKCSVDSQRPFVPSVETSVEIIETRTCEAQTEHAPATCRKHLSALIKHKAGVSRPIQLVLVLRMYRHVVAADQRELTEY